MRAAEPPILGQTPSCLASRHLTGPACITAQRFLSSTRLAAWRLNVCRKAILTLPILNTSSPSLPNQSYFDHKSSSSSVRSSIYNVRTFSQDIKKGDLILSSPRRSYDPFLIGIVEDNFSKESRLIIDPFLENEFTFRSVKWVSSYTSKHDLSASLAVRLENQRAITQIDRSIYGDEVFSVAFKQYSTSDSSKLDIFCPKYTGRNPLETVPVQELIAFFSVLFSLHQQGKLSDIRNKDFNEIINSYDVNDLIKGLTPKRNSPLLFRLIVRDPLLAAFIAAGITLATVEAFNLDQINNIQIVNSAYGSTGMSDIELQELMKSTIRSINPATINSVNDRGKKGKRGVNLSTNSKIKK